MFCGSWALGSFKPEAQVAGICSLEGWAGGGLRLFPVSCCQTPGSRSPPAVGLSVDSRGFGVAGVSGLRALGFRGCRLLGSGFLGCGLLGLVV